MRRYARFDECLCAALFTVAFGLWSAAPAAAANEQDFHVTTTSEYVALCTTDPSDPNYVAAIHFCQGFASGAYQYYLALASHANERYVCLPDPPPTRNAALAGFVAWMKTNPTANAAPPVESIFRYLTQTYPCTQAPR
jgi:hypothetical protein